MSRRERLQRYISTQKLDLYPIPLHLLLLWQAQFLCGDSDYFRVSVTVAQCRARRLGYTDWKGLESITAANISTGMRKIYSHTNIQIWDSVCDDYYVTFTTNVGQSPSLHIRDAEPSSSSLFIFFPRIVHCWEKKSTNYCCFFKCRER